MELAHPLFFRSELPVMRKIETAFRRTGAELRDYIAVAETRPQRIYFFWRP